MEEGQIQSSQNLQDLLIVCEVVWRKQPLSVGTQQLSMGEGQFCFSAAHSSFELSVGVGLGPACLF